MTPQKNQVWIYKESLRSYKVLEVTEDEITYTAAFLSPAYGKGFKRPLSDFMKDFVLPENMTEEIKKESTQRTLSQLGLLG